MTCDCNCAVTVSSTGAKNLLQGDDNGHVGRPCEVSLAPPCPELFCELRGPEGARTRMECPAQARRVPSTSTKRLSGMPSPGAARVDTTASRAGARGRARLAAGTAERSSLFRT